MVVVLPLAIYMARVTNHINTRKEPFTQRQKRIIFGLELSFITFLVFVSLWSHSVRVRHWRGLLLLWPPWSQPRAHMLHIANCMLTRPNQTLQRTADRQENF